jgi:UDP-2,3-diacylglucosamine hydrolase
MHIQRGHTTSDLHLLTNRTSADRLMPALHCAASDAGLFVLNGDIFDFRWSVYPDLDESLGYVANWIADLVCCHPKCRFVFIMGNHDSLAEYGDLLDRLSEKYDNLSWEPYYLNLGSMIFLHGDVYNSHGPGELAAYRQRWHGPPRQPWIHAAYLTFTKLGIARLVYECTPTRRCADDLVTYLKAELGPDFEDLRDVYYGHTHKPLSDYRWKGLRFHNSGATIHGVQSRIQTFTYDPVDLQAALGRITAVDAARSREVTARQA